MPKKGDEILARHFEDIKRMLCEATIEPGACSGIDVLRTPGGTTLTVNSADGTVWVGIVTSGGVSARSGLAPGTGSVELYALDVPTAMLVDVGQQVTAYYISSTTGGIAGGVYVMLEQDANGNYWITAVDCGN